MASVATGKEEILRMLREAESDWSMHREIFHTCGSRYASEAFRSRFDHDTASGLR